MNQISLVFEIYLEKLYKKLSKAVSVIVKVSKLKSYLRHLKFEIYLV